MDSFTATFNSAVAGNTEAPRDQEAMKLRQPAPIMACVIACESRFWLLYSRRADIV